jgi:predicted transcriptional regulator
MAGKSPAMTTWCDSHLGDRLVKQQTSNMNIKMRKIEVDTATAEALEARAAAVGLSVRELLAQMVALDDAAVKLSPEETADLDRQWAGIKAGEPIIAHEDVVRWLDTWGTTSFRSWKDR